MVGINKRVHPHLFRHSFATQLLMSGVDITRVASILGHKDIQTTSNNYVHLADDTLRKATYLHPLVRKNIHPSEILKLVKEAIQTLGIENDGRFDFAINETNTSLAFEFALK